MVVLSFVTDRLISKLFLLAFIGESEEVWVARIFVGGSAAGYLWFDGIT